MAVVCLVAGAGLVACKQGGDAKKRVPGGEPASAAKLIRTMEAVGSFDEVDGVTVMAEGVWEVCGKGCACLAEAVKSQDVDKVRHLYECPSLCTADARAKTVAASPGQRFSTLVGACTPEAIGLTAEAAKKVGDDWVAAFVSGQYLADAYDAANADDKKAYDTAFARFSVPLAPTAAMAGVAIAGAAKTEGPSRSRTFIAIDAKGAITTGTVHQVRYTPSGAQYIPADLKTVADVKALAQQLDPDQTAAAPVTPPLPTDDDPPPPEPEEEDEEDEEDEVGGTGTAMALEEGKMGKKDSDRAAGQYRMKKNTDDEQLARRQAIDQARSAGILGNPALVQGGAFASLTGTGDISSGFDDTGGLHGGEPAQSVVGVTSTPIRDQVVIIADQGAPAQTLLAVMSVVPDGSVLAVESDRGLAVLPFVFTQGGFGFGSLPDRGDDPAVDVRISFGSDLVMLSDSVTSDVTEVKAGDDAALTAAIKKVFDQPSYADRRDVRMLVQEDTKVGQVVPALDAALSAGARTARLETPSTGEPVGAGAGFGPGQGGTGWGTIGAGRYGTLGHGSGTALTVPSVSIGQPNAVGDLDKAIIRRYIKRNIARISYCYDKELLVKPRLAGTVQTQFFIAPNGSVASAQATGVDPEVASCVAAVIKAIEFPKPKGGGGVQVNYPFVFRPAGG